MTSDREAWVFAHWRLAQRVAREYAEFHVDLAYDDLEQEAMLALCVVADRVRPGGGGLATLRAALAVVNAVRRYVRANALTQA